ncbi:Flagellar biosynthesis protein FlhF [hydrothermal vent metagenome]|uniref:Flagellar biosynthesis protein FlhF n=1 Tax=hydrothermal vent metagenome TaxID=652676 RepID=A0A3B0XUU7_9ZZZZ
MKIKRFKAPDMRQAIKMVREEHGADAVILSNRKVHDGIEIISAIDYDESAVETMLSHQGPENGSVPANITAATQLAPQSGFPTDNPFLQNAFQQSALNRAAATSTEQPLSAQLLAQAYATNTVVQNPVAQQQRENIQSDEYKQAEIQQQLLQQQTIEQNNNVGNQPTHPVIEQAQQVIAAAASMGAVHHKASASVPPASRYQNNNVPADFDEENLEDDVATISSCDIDTSTVKKSAAKKSKPKESVLQAVRSVEKPQVSEVKGDEQLKTKRTEVQGDDVDADDEFEGSIDQSDYDTAVNDVAKQLAESSTDERYRKKFDRESEQRDIEVQAMQRELHTLKGMLSNRVASTPQVSIPHVHPAHTGIYARLQELGISSCLCQEVLAKLPLSSEVNEGWRKALAILAHGIKTVDSDVLETGGVIAMIGPTGVGKTTTIAKMAARYALKYGRESVAIVSVDNYRIAAQDQILSYGQMIGVPVFLAAGKREFRSIMDDLCDKQLILVDTAGMGQRDPRITEQFELMSDVPYDLHTYLVMSANTQEAALNQIASAYTDQTINGCILTKLDETVSLGGMLSMLTKWKLPVSFMTEGQRVPEDLLKIRPYSLVSKAVTMMQQIEILDTTASTSMPDREDIYNANA